jgi:hypothetical protein
MAISSLLEWKKLPEVNCPVVGVVEKGEIYRVKKVGFLALSTQDCEEAYKPVAVFEMGKYFFPTLEAIISNNVRVHRLPLQLGN